MLLSIGMIVKNEEKYLQKCLEGLVPILRGIDSELIIFDTGSADRTVEIAKKFTDKVFQIEWRNDFAWARNHTIDKAVGSWYMFIDADEVFEDTGEIISFFANNDYQRYNSASILINNLSVDGTSSKIRITRLVKLESDTRFEDAIHETITPKLPCKDLNCIANHYGYYYESNEDRKAKFERNLPPNLLIFENENPKTARTVMNIINGYWLVKDLDKVRDFLKIGFEIVQGDQAQRNPYFHAFHTKWAECLFHEEKYQETVEYIRNYFTNLKKIAQNAVILRHNEAAALQHLGKFKEAGDAQAKAHELFLQNRRGLLDTEVALVSSLSNQYLENEAIHVECLVVYYVLASEYELGKKWFDYADRHGLISDRTRQLAVAGLAHIKNQRDAKQ